MSIIEPGEQRVIGPEPAGPAQPATPAPDTEIVVDVPGEFTPDEPDTFDRKYVEELRAENAKWRTQLREREALFEGLEADEVTQLAEFARLSKKAETGDEEAIKALNEMLGDEEVETAAPSEPAPVFDEERFRKLAREEAERIAADRDSQRAQRESIQTIVHRAEELGYKQGSEDYVLLMRAANSINPDEHPDLLAEGDRLVKEYKAQIVESYLAAKEGRAEASPTIPSGSGVAPSSARVPASFPEARDSLRQRLDAARGR